MKAFPDTNVWIAWLGRAERAGKPAGTRRYQLFLTTIALQELWAGAGSADESRYFSTLLDAARRRGRLINPPPAAWIMAGRTLRQLGRRRRLGGARLRNLRNDVLLAATAVAHGATILTHNRADFTLIRSALPVEFVAPD